MPFQLECIAENAYLEDKAILFRGWGGALPYLAYTGQVRAAEHKVLSIKQGVEFYYQGS